MNSSILLTGTSRGIGYAITERFLQEEWTVHGASTKMIDEWKHNQSYHHTILDLFEVPNAIDSWMDPLISSKHLPPVVINNAAIFLESPIESDEADWLDKWRKTIEVNLTASSYIAKKAIQYWAEHDIPGILINISSRAAQRGDTQEFAAYAASKAGMLAFIKSVARNYGKKGITAFSVAPGFVHTDMAIESIQTYGEEYLTQGLALNEIVPPEDIATLVYRIASGEFKHATGQTFHVNSGSYMV